MRRLIASAFGLFSLTFIASPALAHATLETAAAPLGAYKAVLRVPHGCDGDATHTVRIELPEGFIAAKPMPKAGWQLDVESGTYAGSYTLHGRTVDAGATVVTWSGGDLPDAFYDEFIIAGTLAGAEAGDSLYFKTTQMCASGVVEWMEVPAPGQDPHSLAGPAPSVTIIAAGGDIGVPDHGEHDHSAHGQPTQDHAGHTHEEASDPADPSGTIRAGDLEIGGFWTRAMLPNQRVGGGYLTITNTASSDDRLIGVTSDVTDRVEIHEMSMANDVMTMRRLEDGLVVPGGETVSLAPGGYHLMFQDMDTGFVEGESVRVTLTFERAGDVAIDLPVLPANAGRGTTHRH